MKTIFSKTVFSLVCLILVLCFLILPGNDSAVLNLWGAPILKMLFDHIVNKVIAIFGIVAICLSLALLFKSREKRADLDKRQKNLKINNPRGETEKLIECVAGINANNPYIRKMNRLSDLLESTQGEKFSNEGDEILKNFYFQLVEALPLAGIIGTLYSIANYAAHSGAPSGAALQENLGIALGSTLIALGATVLCKIIEAFWRHNYQYIEDINEILSVIELTQSDATKLDEPASD